MQQRLTVIDSRTGEKKRLSLSEVLNVRADRNRNKSTPSPLEQNLVLFSAQPSMSALSLRAVQLLTGTSLPTPQHYIVIELTMIHGCRISEVLRLKGADISPQGVVFINSLKGSKPRIIHLIYSKIHALKFSRQLCMPFADFNRKYWWKEFIRLNLLIQFANTKKRAVTHSGRHCYITELSNLTNDITTIKNHIGHVSEKSTVGYIHNKKKSVNNSLRHTR
jgi:integrase